MQRAPSSKADGSKWKPQGVPPVGTRSIWKPCADALLTRALLGGRWHVPWSRVGYKQPIVTKRLPFAMVHPISSTIIQILGFSVPLDTFFLDPTSPLKKKPTFTSRHLTAVQLFIIIHNRHPPPPSTQQSQGHPPGPSPAKAHDFLRREAQEKLRLVLQQLPGAPARHHETWRRAMAELCRKMMGKSW